MKQRPTLDQYVEAFLTAMRAVPTEKIVSTSAGTMRVHGNGERVLYGPNGAAIRVIEDPERNTQVETDDRLHAVIRPPTIRVHLPRGART